MEKIFGIPNGKMSLKKFLKKYLQKNLYKPKIDLKYLKIKKYFCNFKN